MGVGHATSKLSRSPSRLAGPFMNDGMPSLGGIGAGIMRVSLESPSFAASGITVSGVTKDSTGAILGSCVVQLFRTTDDAIIAETTSDPTTGAYAFWPTVSGPFYVVAYKAGAPDVAGTTVNTLVPA